MTTVMKYPGEYKMSVPYSCQAQEHKKRDTCTINYLKCTEDMNSHLQFYIFKNKQNAAIKIQ
jgi:hypothetical protein